MYFTYCTKTRLGRKRNLSHFTAKLKTFKSCCHLLSFSTLSVRLILAVCRTHVKMNFVRGQGVYLVFEFCWGVRFFLDEHYIFLKPCAFELTVTLNLIHIERKYYLLQQSVNAFKGYWIKTFAVISFFLSTFNFMILLLSISCLLWNVFNREKASLQHEIEDKEDMIRQRNGEIQVHSLNWLHFIRSSFSVVWIFPHCWLRDLKECFSWWGAKKEIKCSIGKLKRGIPRGGT